MSYDPMESFEVRKIISIDVFGIDLSITNSSVFMMLVVGMVCGALWLGTSKSDIVPTKFQVIIEKLFFFSGEITKSNFGNNSVLIFPYVTALFLFIMIGNVVGLFPFAFSFTSQLIVTIGMASAVFFASIAIGIRTQGIRYFRHFCPAGVPSYLVPFFLVIESMSFLFRPISLGVRLFANMVAGHIMIKVISGFAVSLSGMKCWAWMAILPISVNVLLNVFKLAVCVLQAYVFVMLSCMYLSESMEVSA